MNCFRSHDISGVEAGLFVHHLDEFVTRNYGRPPGLGLEVGELVRHLWCRGRDPVLGEHVVKHLDKLVIPNHLLDARVIDQFSESGAALGILPDAELSDELLGADAAVTCRDRVGDADARRRIGEHELAVGELALFVPTLAPDRANPVLCVLPRFREEGFAELGGDRRVPPLEKVVDGILRLVLDPFGEASDIQPAEFRPRELDEGEYLFALTRPNREATGGEFEPSAHADGNGFVAHLHSPRVTRELTRRETAPVEPVPVVANPPHPEPLVETGVDRLVYLPRELFARLGVKQTYDPARVPRRPRFPFLGLTIPPLCAFRREVAELDFTAVFRVEYLEIDRERIGDCGFPRRQ